MTTQEAIETLKLMQGQVEWDYPMEYTVAVDMAVDALQKQIHKKPIPDGYKDKCPVCGLVVKFGERYCKGCGQKLRWDE